MCVLIPDLEIKTHEFYNSQPATVRGEDPMTLGSWLGPHPLRGSGDPKEGAGKRGIMHNSRSKVLGGGEGAFFFFIFWERGRLFIVQRVVSGYIAFVFITF